MSEQEPGAVEAMVWRVAGTVTRYYPYLTDEKRTSITQTARAHDAEDARRAAEFAAMHAEAARLAGRLIEREEYIDEREAVLARLVAALDNRRKYDRSPEDSPFMEKFHPGVTCDWCGKCYEEIARVEDAALAAVRAGAQEEK